MLIGREVESARLAAALASARGGVGGTLVLLGESGIGKTSLLRKLLEQAGDMVVLEARGVESEADLPYAALVDILTPVLHRLDALPEAQVVALSTALALAPPAAVDRFAAGVSTLGLLRAAAEEGPVLIVVDDLPWIDSSSRDVLSFASRRLSSIPVLLVAAQRDDADGTPLLTGAEILPVTPLGDEDATRLLMAAAGDMAQRVKVKLVDAARGNPLALVELPNLLTPGQRAGTEALVDPLPAANGLERAFAARLAPLSASGGLAAVVAAADGSGTAGVVLDALESMGLGEPSLREVEALGLLRIDGNRIEFRHPLVRSAAYHGAHADELRSAHAALAEADTDPDRHALGRG